MNMKNEGLNIGSLCTWAKKDNEAEYKKISMHSIDRLLLKSISSTHTCIARVIHRMYMDDFVCASIKKNIWYEFKCHRWVEVENAYTLRYKISSELSDIYKIKSISLCEKANNPDLKDANERSRLLDISKTLGELSIKMQQTSFKESLIKESSEMFFDPGFEQKLDANKKLIGFTNGVYDLENHEFRQGFPSDFLTMSTGYDFILEDDAQIQTDLMAFVTSFMPNEAMKEYILKVCAYMLDGSKYMECLWFFTGSGRNSKGTFCILLCLAFGNYYYEPDVSLVTSIKNSSSGTNSEVAKAKGKRIMCLTEPEPDGDARQSTLKVSTIKKFRGNDLIQARGLYKDFIEFRPMFGMIIQMNERPRLSNVDEAIALSLKIVNFPFQFVDEPKEEHQRKKDSTIKYKFEKGVKYWQQFMRILMKYHKTFISGNKVIDEPEEVRAATKEYLEENNPISTWFNQHYEVTHNDNDKISVDVMFEAFYPKPEYFTKNKFGKFMAMLKHKSKPFHGTRFYIGIKTKMVIEDVHDDLDNMPHEDILPLNC
jgi:putative DNA primase/helicase